MARKKNLKEETPVQPVIEPTPEDVSSTAVSAASPGQAHSNRPIDQTDQKEPMTRAETNAAVINAVLSADDQKANAILAAIPEKMPEEDPGKPEEKNDAISDAAAAHNTSSHDMKPSDASPSMMEQALDTVFAGEELSESFKNRATAIFEAVVTQKVQELEEQLTAELAEDFEAQLDNERTTLAESIDAYLNDAAAAYLKENELHITNGIKSDLYESMMTDIGNVFKSYNVAIDDSQIDLVTEAYAENDALNEKVERLLEENGNMREENAALAKGLIFEDIARGLTAIQREHFATLVESVEADDVDVMTDKMSALKEHVQATAKAPSTTAKAFVLTEEVTAEEQETPKYTHQGMSAYVSAVSKSVK